MGEVYRARDARLNRDVAIKVVTRRVLSRPGPFVSAGRRVTHIAANRITGWNVDNNG